MTQKDYQILGECVTYYGTPIPIHKDFVAVRLKRDVLEKLFTVIREDERRKVIRWNAEKLSTPDHPVNPDEMEKQYLADTEGETE